MVGGWSQLRSAINSCIEVLDKFNRGIDPWKKMGALADTAFLARVRAASLWLAKAEDATAEGTSCWGQSALNHWLLTAEAGWVGGPWV